MLENELQSLITRIIENRAEEQNIEVKSTHDGCPKRLYDTLSSFSNQDSGGVIVFGLDERESFAPVGVYDVQDLQKKVTEQCNDMEPVVRGVFSLTTYKGVNICSLEVPGIEITERPCYYRGKGKIKGSYIRVGDADSPMTDYEIYSFEAFKKHVHDDERKVERANEQNMNMDEIKSYLVKKREERPKFARLDDEQGYEMLGIKRDGKFTLAAVMNFCLYPQGLFPQLGITAVVVPGSEIGQLSEDSARFLDNKRIEGTISEMLDEAMAFCKRNMKSKTVIESETGRRVDKTEYPLNAIREAILNALIHRDYSIHTEGTPIQINFFNNRLEIHSPGGLYGRMTVEQLGKVKPDLRNPTLATMAESLSKTENRYSGIPTIRREMKEWGLKEPVFKENRNEFIVILYNEEEISEDLSISDRVLKFCEQPRTRKEIANLLDINTLAYAYSRYIEPLIKAGKLVLLNPNETRSRNHRYIRK